MLVMVPPPVRDQSIQDRRPGSCRSPREAHEAGPAGLERAALSQNLWSARFMQGDPILSPLDLTRFRDDAYFLLKIRTASPGVGG